jgi:hypothetical protein
MRRLYETEEGDTEVARSANLTGKAVTGCRSAIRQCCDWRKRERRAPLRCTAPKSASRVESGYFGLQKVAIEVSVRES